MLTLIAASLAWATPVAGGSPPPPAPSASRIVSELDGYAAWLARLSEIQEPVQAELIRIGAEMQVSARDADPAGAVVRLRPSVARSLAAIEHANTALRDLGAPDFPGLGLDENVRPAAILRETIALNGRLRTAVEGFGPMLDAISSHDEAAILSAMTDAISSFRLVVESKVVLARAGLAAIERDTPAWEIAHIDLISLQAIARIFAAYPHNSLTGSDPTLARDLASFAHQLDLAADSGAAKIEAELNRLRASLAEADRNREADYAEILRRNIAILTIDRDVAPIAREMALSLSVGSTSLDGPSITTNQLNELVHRLQPIRMRLLTMMSAETAALQGAH
jgi:hypothetical protein